MSAPIGEPTVVVLRGLPLTGKTTLGRALSKALGWVYVDVNGMRALAARSIDYRHDQVNPWADEDRARRESEDMDIAYALVHAAVAENVQRGRSIIISATYSWQERQHLLLQAALANPRTRVRTIRLSFNDEPKEIRRRLADKLREEGYCGTVEHYLTDRDVRHDYTHLPELGPLLELNSSKFTPEQEVEVALRFITE
ncbi:MAG: AAA family ATPase [Candidatus Liptonbacteria bacterium]